MAQKRIEWACPECNKRFAIPSNANLPERCPDCQQSASQKEEIKIKIPPPLPAIDTPLPHFEGAEPVEIAAPSIAVPAQQRNRISNKNVPRKYPTLRMVSLGYRVLGWLIVLATLGSNLIESMRIVELNDKHFFKSTSSFMATFIGRNTAILITGSFFALIAFAFAELIILFIDIEENTRETSQNTGTT
ncbi:hypothetical protein MNBD_PLANCTO02-2512 [hydrothermal vent metagenome]|uniref:Uncharacterized protein n=1 Tax=hydrothermal vent metagenome TaxID=652676 RepID=A0A3B1E120_9ZZZZ